jgi:hypothetical protein
VRHRRIHKTGGQPTQADIAEAGLLLLLLQEIQIATQLRHRMAQKEIAASYLTWLFLRKSRSIVTPEF